jgi:hypothetical protein
MKSFLLLGLATTLLVVASACSFGDDSSTGRGGDPAPGAQMAHIHGLDVDPGNGAVYAGTHLGLFRIEGGAATRVADRVQDFMGFTVVGPDHFLASGHPGAGQGGHSSVGLIESVDAGETWQERSLGGEADFHALEYRHGRVFGVNAMTGQLLASDDFTAWDVLGQEPITDFAVSPETADELIATTQQGLLWSVDAGRSFESVASAPVMVFVGWGADGGLVGVSPDGVVHTADDPSGEWIERGNLGGQPEALTVQSADEIYAAVNGDVLISTDGGSTFTSITNL